ncbi:hypothetical protein [Mycoplasma phocimorsus]|uniref:hypothetical protein n=1 Tax=Mycoplasma phocimorsus TaxID=3045839 RepID=UPI0024C0A273|nr:hypothetical protein [Mycoplasma phocimorsus]MDJ1648058.1 hypothetical protein [Mycoplasma phocimorsus]
MSSKKILKKYKKSLNSFYSYQDYEHEFMPTYDLHGMDEARMTGFVLTKLFSLSSYGKMKFITGIGSGVLSLAIENIFKSENLHYEKINSGTYIVYK